jgi:predicted ATPase
VAVQLAPLVERELELETVERSLAGARTGSGGAVVLEGPAGIGKSSLLAAARTSAAPDLRVLSARGGQLERELPFGIVRQLLEPVVATDPVEREVLLAGAAALAQPVLSESDPETGGEASFSALHGL